ncbi:MAG: hypothetical protein HY436_01315 [Candidatus Liptonbacteria bacterium]|nr:hypothetical protein [Candidatus Liptonbacteria bacterium]
MSRRRILSPATIWALTFFLSAAFAAIHALPAAEAAFGVSPPFVHADRLVRGSRFSKTIYLVQDQPNEDISIHAELSIPESVRSWISLEPGYDFTIPRGVRQFPVTVTVAVPQNIALGSYDGAMTFETRPTEKGQVTIALGVQVAVNIRVGTGIFRDYTISLVKPLDIEEGWNPRAYVKFENRGNVSEVLNGATFELLDQFGSVRLAFAQKDQGFPEIAPFESREFTIEFPINFNLAVGQYWGAIGLIKDEKVVANQRAVFRVLKRGALSSPFAVIASAIGKNWLLTLIFLAAIVFLAFQKKRLTVTDLMNLIKRR